MDPDACLAELRDLVARVRNARGAPEKVHPDHQDGTDELLEHVEALDEWLSKGGFPPSDWIAREKVVLPGGKRPGRVDLVTSHGVT